MTSRLTNERSDVDALEEVVRANGGCDGVELQIRQRTRIALVASRVSDARRHLHDVVAGERLVKRAIRRMSDDSFVLAVSAIFVPENYESELGLSSTLTSLAGLGALP